MRQYLYIVILIIIGLYLASCSNVKMACTLSESKALDKKENKEISPTISDKAKDCANNPTILVFKEF